MTTLSVKQVARHGQGKLAVVAAGVGLADQGLLDFRVGNQCFDIRAVRDIALVRRVIRRNDPAMAGEVDILQGLEVGVAVEVVGRQQLAHGLGVLVEVEFFLANCIGDLVQLAGRGIEGLRGMFFEQADGNQTIEFFGFENQPFILGNGPPSLQRDGEQDNRQRKKQQAAHRKRAAGLVGRCRMAHLTLPSRQAVSSCS